MEFFVANFIANKEDFFKAKIQQSDNEHVSVNGNKFMILGERKFEKHLEAIVSPENIQYFFDEIKEIISEPIRSVYQKLIDTFKLFKKSLAYDIVLNEINEDPYLVRKLNISKLARAFKDYLDEKGIRNAVAGNYISMNNTLTIINGINSWNDHILLISSLDRSIDLIIIDGSLKINFTLPFSSIDNDKENYREIFEQLHYKSLPKKSYEVSREFKTFTKATFKGLYHEIFDIEVSKLRNLNQISSLLNQNYVELLNEFLRFISPIYNHKFTAYDYKEIINFVENVIENLDVRYVLLENNIVSKFSIKSSMDINIQLEVYSLNVFNNKYDIRIMVGNKHDFRIDLEIEINGKNELHFNFTSYHLKAEYRI